MSLTVDLGPVSSKGAVAKGNPASKRMTNPRKKATRSLSWQRSQKRKDKRREANAKRAAANKVLIAEFGGLVADAPGKGNNITAQKIRKALAAINGGFLVG